MTLKTLKPLDFGKGKLIPPEEALRQLEAYQPEPPKGDSPNVEDETKPDTEPSPIITPPSELVAGSYILMPRTNTYALGVEALREAYRKGECLHHPAIEIASSRWLVRPLTFKENIAARVKDYHTDKGPDGSARSMEDRLKLFTERWLDSCTSMVYKAESTKFKVNTVSAELIEIDKNFKKSFLPVDYRQVLGIALDSSRGKYNELLTKAEVLEHGGWLAAVEGDDKLLETYAEIVFAQLKERYNQDSGMGFYVRKGHKKDELRALFVNILSDYSVASGGNYLGNGGSFLRVAHNGTP